jgi:FkbM family methyltransferase
MTANVDDGATDERQAGFRGDPGQDVELVPALEDVGYAAPRFVVGRARYLLLRALRRIGVLSHLNLRLAVLHGARRVVVPVVGGVGLGHWALADPQLLPVIRIALRLRSGAFVDVGAHLGETLLKLFATGDRRVYVGVEPQPSAAAYIKRLLDANRYRGEVIAAAFGDRNGVAELRLTGELDDSATIVAGFRSDERERERRLVPVVCGDEALAAIGVARVGVLKIDVEGAEVEVLNGLAGTIERDRPIVLCEVLPVYDEASGVGRMRRARSDAVSAFAIEHRYRLLRIGEGALDSVDGIETHGDLSLRDYVLVPSEEHARFIDLSSGRTCATGRRATR